LLCHALYIYRILRLKQKSILRHTIHHNPHDHVYNIKTRKTIGYETILGRVIKIIWGVFSFSWIGIIIISLLNNVNPVQDILFVLGMTLMMSGLIIKFNKITLGGLLLIIFTVYTYFVPDLNFLLVNVVGITFGMLIPGFALYLQKKDE
jgi:hypothetical protein